MMDCSIIIVNYKTPQLAADAVRSVYEHTSGIEFEVIVVDNASGDGSENILSALKNIKFIRSDMNIGFGRANNLGLESAKGRNILFLNPDTLLMNNAVKILSDFLDCTPDAGICGGNLYNAKGQPTHSFKMYIPSLRNTFGHIKSRIRYGKNAEFNLSGTPREAGYITGADMMLRKSFLDRHGAFDPDFFMYYEETELAFRVKRAGQKVYSVPSAHIMHLEGKSPVFNAEKQKQILRSRRIYYKKTHSERARRIADILFYSKCLINIMLSCLTFNFKKARFWTAILKEK